MITSSQDPPPKSPGQGSLFEDPVFRPTQAGGFSQGMKAGAVVGTIVAPFISLIIALVMLGDEQNPVRKSFLKTWAAVSGGILAVWLLIVIALFAAVSSAGPHVSDKGPCQGGPVMGAQGEQIGPHRWRFPCEFGGHAVVNLP